MREQSSQERGGKKIVCVADDWDKTDMEADMNIVCLNVAVKTCFFVHPT